LAFSAVILLPLFPGTNAIKKPLRRIESMKRTSVVMMMVILVLSVFALYGCPKSADVSSAPESQPQKVEKTPEALAAEAKAADEKKAADAAAAAKAAEEEAAAKASAGN